MGFKPSNKDSTVDVGGAKFRPVHMERHMRVFPVDESEIVSLSILNDLTTAFFSGASTLFVLSVGIVIDLALQDQYWGNYTTEHSKFLLYILVPIFIVAAILLLLAGIWALRKRTSVWDNINNSCTEIDSK